ncbi:DUF1446 domain-containing protein [Cupriavidus necator]|uniref:DUF1446 domain-containing protein n=1 Tax=Cupriavidus necator TaxID=106590 RepID=A0A1U9UWN3_CUPNE|nr:acyclic terpene utilization AtuA family protein [Cupriavidus necator]AQV96621.1 DUF1446 domain-containing protein [Cupriavidus necator]
MNSKSSFLIGAASAFSGDRRDAAVPVVETLIRRNLPSCLIFETLAERTLALAQLERRKDPEAGFDPWLEDILEPVLDKCLRHGIKIVSNFGAANPRAAARRIQSMATRLGIRSPRIAVVSGDDLSSDIYLPFFREALGDSLDEARMVAANVYLGSDSVADALLEGAEIVVTGRVSDSALCVGPLLAHFGWARDDWTRRGRAVMAGHLLECGVQVTGGYFADPGVKDVPNLFDIGYPIAEVDADGNCIITKADNTGGLVDTRVVREQMLYEIDDPSAYLAPDAISDISNSIVEQMGPDCVRVSGVQGREWPSTLKVLVCQDGGWLGEGEISYAGPRAEARARLAADIVKHRLGAKLDLRIDLIGVLSIHGDDAGRRLARTPQGSARDVRLRVAAVHQDPKIAELVGREVTALYTCGPAGGGGVRAGLRQRLDTLPCYVPRSAIQSNYEIIE